MAHALNRLQAIFQAKTGKITGGHKTNGVDWNNGKEVEDFVKITKVKDPTWKEFGYYYVNGRMPDDFYTRVDEAVQSFHTKKNGNVPAKLAVVNKLFCEAQDSLVFSEPPVGDEMTAFLAKFETTLDAAVK